jgi:hypothetical protein
LIVFDISIFVTFLTEWPILLINAAMSITRVVE